MKKKRSYQWLLQVISFYLVRSSLYAATDAIWQAPTAGTWSWGDSSNWYNGIIADGGDNAIFGNLVSGSAGAMTVTLPASYTISNLTLNGYYGWRPITISPTAGATLSLSSILFSSTTANQITAPLIPTADLNITYNLGVYPSTAINSITGGISGSYGLNLILGATDDTPYQLQLGGTNTYSGTTTIPADSGRASMTLSALNTNAFSVSSSHVINGTLNLNNFNNELSLFSGNGFIQLGSALLTVTGSNTNNFNGTISGTGSFLMEGGSLTLNKNQGYTGSTTIDSGATLILNGNGSIASSTSLLMNGTLDISSISGGAATVRSLSGTNAGAVVSLGTKKLSVIASNESFSGSIQGTSGSFGLTSGTLTLMTPTTSSSYTGITQVDSGATLITGASNVLSSSSLHQINGTLNLNSFSNQVSSLAGSGSILLGSADLTLGGAVTSSFSGNISGTGNLLVNAGHFSLTTAQSYTGSTTIGSGGELKLSSLGSIATSSSVLLNGSLDCSNVSGSSTTLYNLSGTNAGAVMHLGEKNVTIFAGVQDFPGSIQGTSGSLTIATGSFSLFPPSTPSDYAGITEVVSGASMGTAATNLLAPSSLHEINGTLNLNSFSNQIAGLSGSGSVLLGSATLTLAGTEESTFSGNLSGTGNLVVNGGIFSLTNPQSYTGSTTIGSNGRLDLTSSGSIASSQTTTVNGIFDCSNGPSSTFINNLNGTNSDAQIILGIATLSIAETGSQTFSGSIQGIDGSIHLTSGTLNLSSPSSPSTYSGTTEIDASSTLAALGTNVFSHNSAHDVTGTLNLNGYSNQIGTLSGSGSVDLTTATLTLVQNVGSTFSGNISGSGNLVVNAGSFSLTNPQSYTGSTTIGSGAQLNLGTTDVISNSSILVLNGILDLQGYNQTIASLQGSGTLRFSSGESVTINDGDNNFYAGLIEGTGNLSIATGNFTLSPPSLLSYTGTTTVDPSAVLWAGNVFAFSPNSSFVVDGTLSLNHFSNSVATLSGSGSVDLTGATLTLSKDIGSTFSGNISGSGNLVVNAGSFSLTNPQSYTGSTNIKNLATLELSSLGSISASKQVTVDGLLKIDAAMNASTQTLLGSGQVQLGTNSTLELLSGGNFSGEILGDALTQLSQGNLELLGKITTTDYTQLSLATLTLSYDSFVNPPLHVAVGNHMNLAGSLVVQDQNSAPFPETENVVIMTAEGGRNGTFSSVKFQGFTDQIPHISYTPHSVELTLVPAITPTASFSISPISFGFINARSFLVQRNQHFLHEKMMPSLSKVALEMPTQEIEEEELNSASFFAEMEEVPFFEEEIQASFLEEEHQRIELTEKIVEKGKNPWRVYAGPIESLQTIDSTSSSSNSSISAQSTGFFSGFDYAFSDFGIGASGSYVSTWGDGPRQNSNFQFDQSQFAVYSTYLPMEDKALAINAIGGFGFNEYHLQRVAGLDFTKIAKSSFGAFHFNLLWGAEYSFSQANFSKMPESFRITPMLNFQYSQIFTQSYQESGAGIYNLDVGSIDPNSLTSLLAIRFDLPFSGENWKFKTEIDIGWQYEMLNQDQNLAIAIPNLPNPQNFSVPIQGLDRNSLWVGCDLFLTVWDHFQIEGSYDLQYNQQVTSQNFYLGFGGDF